MPNCKKIKHSYEKSDNLFCFALKFLVWNDEEFGWAVKLLAVRLSQRDSCLQLVGFKSGWKDGAERNGRDCIRH